MEIVELVMSLIRWFHIIAGILFVGMLWWLCFVSVFFDKLVRDTPVRPPLPVDVLVRTLSWIQWAGRFTWVLGFLLLGRVFYGGGMMFEPGVEHGIGGYIMLAVVFLIAPLYNALSASPLRNKGLLFAAVCLLVVAAVVYGMVEWGHFAYRAYVIHAGVMFGTLMVANVENTRRAQQRILKAVSTGTGPEAADLELVTQRFRHNAYLSVPLLWTMINAHTPVPAADSWLYLTGIVGLGWLLAALTQWRVLASSSTPG